MLANAHLPAAVTDCDLDTISRREECEIRKMAEECGRWLRSFEECRASLVSPSARTVWAALIQGEFDQVSQTYERLTSEMQVRSQMAGR